ncbi:cytochrome ubiquinol oxidase subunit I [Bacillus paranthracis]
MKYSITGRKIPTTPLWQKRWTKAFAILLGVAIPTGTIVGVQISLLWPGFAKIVGQVISVPFQIEIFAFFFRGFVHVHLCICD